MNGKKLPSWRGTLWATAALPLVALAAAAALGLAGCGPGRAAEGRKTHVTPRARYEPLAKDEVYARASPGRQERIKWVYRARGLPLQIIAETDGWRRVCDPDGAVSWVSKRGLGGRPALYNRSDQPLALRRRRGEGFPVTALLRPRSLVRLDRCEDGWCRARAGSGSGWVREGPALWGAARGVQCRLG